MHKGDLVVVLTDGTTEYKSYGPPLQKGDICKVMATLSSGWQNHIGAASLEYRPILWLEGPLKQMVWVTEDDVFVVYES